METVPTMRFKIFSRAARVTKNSGKTLIRMNDNAATRALLRRLEGHLAAQFIARLRPMLLPNQPQELAYSSKLTSNVGMWARPETMELFGGEVWESVMVREKYSARR